MFDVAPSTFAETMPRMSCLAVRKEGSRENPDAAVVGQICQFLVQTVHRSRNRRLLGIHTWLSSCLDVVRGLELCVAHCRRFCLSWR